MGTRLYHPFRCRSGTPSSPPPRPASPPPSGGSSRRSLDDPERVAFGTVAELAAPLRHQRPDRRARRPQARLRRLPGAAGRGPGRARPAALAPAAERIRRTAAAKRRPARPHRSPPSSPTSRPRCGAADAQALRHAPSGCSPSAGDGSSSSAATPSGASPPPSPTSSASCATASRCSSGTAAPGRGPGRPGRRRRRRRRHRRPPLRHLGARRRRRPARRRRRRRRRHRRTAVAARHRRRGLVRGPRRGRRALRQPRRHARPPARPRRRCRRPPPRHRPPTGSTASSRRGASPGARRRCTEAAHIGATPGAMSAVHHGDAPHGMVCSVDHLASAAGVAVLRHGGSAADAAVAASAVLAVTSPHLCGMGGDLFALVHAPGEPTRRPRSTPAGGPAAAPTPSGCGPRATPPMPFHGDVRSRRRCPGCVDGWLALHERFGRLPLADVLAAAIALRRPRASRPRPLLAAAQPMLDGVAGADDLARRAAARGPATVVRRPGVARALAAVVEHGRAGFYEGEFGDGLLRLGAGEYAPDDLRRAPRRLGRAARRAGRGATTSGRSRPTARATSRCSAPRIAEGLAAARRPRRRRLGAPPRRGGPGRRPRPPRGAARGRRRAGRCSTTTRSAAAGRSSTPSAARRCPTARSPAAARCTSARPTPTARRVAHPVERQRLRQPSCSSRPPASGCTTGASASPSSPATRPSTAPAAGRRTRCRRRWSPGPTASLARRRRHHGRRQPAPDPAAAAGRWLRHGAVARRRRSARRAGRSPAAPASTPGATPDGAHGAASSTHAPAAWADGLRERGHDVVVGARREAPTASATPTCSDATGGGLGRAPPIPEPRSAAPPAHWPVNLGARFSKKAATPSAWSADAKHSGGRRRGAGRWSATDRPSPS